MKTSNKFHFFLIATLLPALFLPSCGFSALSDSDVAATAQAEARLTETALISAAIEAYEQGFEHFNNEDLQDALASVDEAISLDPDYGAAYTLRAKINNGLLRFEEAVSDLLMVIELNPDNVSNYATLGKAYYRSGELEKAVTNFNIALEFDSEDAVTFYDRGLALSSAGDYESAVEDFGRAIELNPEYAEAYASRGYSLGLYGDIDRALADFDTALALNPDNQHTNIQRAFVLAVAGYHEDAVALLTSMIRDTPSFADAFFSRGGSYAEMGRFEDAVADAQVALDLGLDPVLEQELLGYLVYWQGYLDDIAREKPDFLVSLASAIAYMEDMENQMAIPLLDRAIELEPTRTEGYFYRAMANFRMNLFETAISDYLEAINLGEKSDFAYYPLGYSYLAVGDFEEAVEAFSLAIQVDNQIGKYYLFRGQAYMGLSLDDEAIRDIERAIELGLDFINSSAADSLLLILRE